MLAAGDSSNLPSAAVTYTSGPGGDGVVGGPPAEALARAVTEALAARGDDARSDRVAGRAGRLVRARSGRRAQPHVGAVGPRRRAAGVRGAALRGGGLSGRHRQSSRVARHAHRAAPQRGHESFRRVGVGRRADGRGGLRRAGAGAAAVRAPSGGGRAAAAAGRRRRALHARTDLSDRARRGGGADGPGRPESRRHVAAGATGRLSRRGDGRRPQRSGRAGERAHLRRRGRTSLGRDRRR